MRNRVKWKKAAKVEGIFHPRGLPLETWARHGRDTNPTQWGKWLECKMLRDYFGGVKGLPIMGKPLFTESKKGFINN